MIDSRDNNVILLYNRKMIISLITSFVDNVYTDMVVGILHKSLIGSYTSDP